MYILLTKKSIAQVCPENEEYETCGTACPKTCQNMNSAPHPCVMICMTGCFCKSPYVRSTANGKCVLARDCSK